ncbi:MAG TPA: LacI family transcriptional regulator [Microbacterium sp.]|nr:LacI family transcriptional regulator [Microbacterium sp.]
MSSIADVAALAGVSKATASRALTGRGYVSDKTRIRVQDAASTLSYVAHSTAASLATGLTHNVSVIIPSVDRWFFAELLEGIQTSLLAFDHDLTLYGSRENSPARSRLFDETLPRRRFDGTIAVGITPGSAEMDQLLRIDRPLITVSSFDQRASAVSIDDPAAVRIATEHLIDLGHENIVFIGGPDATHKLSHSETHRLAGYHAAMDAAGLAPCVRHAVANSTMPGGYAAATDLLGDRRRRPTAVIGVCDEVAIGAIIAARRLGIAVPTELSVVGIDDHAHAEMFALTTIRQRPREQGREAVRLLRERMKHPNAPIEHIVAPSSLSVRSSTAAPR